MMYFVLIERFKMPLSILRPSDGLGITLEISGTVYWLSTPVKNGLLRKKIDTRPLSSLM